MLPAMRAMLKRYRLRPLNLTNGYKPLDFGTGRVNGSINQDGRIIAVNTYDQQTGYITLTSAPPFAEDQRYNADAVRRYRRELTELDGFGLRFDSPIVHRAAWLIEDAIPYMRLTLANGIIAEAVTFVPRDLPCGAIQIWAFAEGGDLGRIDGQLWLQRAAYTQLTEGGPAPMPATLTAHRPITTPDADQSASAIYNDDLGAMAVMPALDGRAGEGDGSVWLSGTPSFDPDAVLVLPFALNGDGAKATDDYAALRDADAANLLTGTLDYWREMWRHSPPVPRAIERPIRRGWSYGLLCALPTDHEATCIITDHMLLPLSWNRDSYYVARALLDGLPVTGERVVRAHLIWLFERAQRTESGAWGRSYMANGAIKDDAFQLDQQIFPILELADYVLHTGDRATLARLRGTAEKALEALLAYRTGDSWLLPTDETPADDPIALKYHFSSHVLLWRALKQWRRAVDDAALDPAIDLLKASIQRHFIAPHDDGLIYAYAADGDGKYHFYHDANDVPLVMMPHWGFTSADDPVWRDTIAFAFSKGNVGGHYGGQLGSVHTRAPWPLGDAQELIIARTRGDKTAEKAIHKRIAATAQWDGALSEAYAQESRRVVSRNWFAWPNAMLAWIYAERDFARRPINTRQRRIPPMKIGFVATRLAGVDGVSLEAAKLVQVLEEAGHECFYIAGQLDDDGRAGWQVPSMHFYDPVARQIHDEVFRNPNPQPKTFRRIYTLADTIRVELEAFVEEFGIDMLIPQNASTIPMNIPLGIAIADLVRRTRIKTLCHHHDFYWERDRFINNGIEDVLRQAFPPNLAPIHHLTINTPMKRRLYQFRGIESTYLPNVFDFANPPPPPDDYALSFRREMGLSDDDLIVLQPTRIIRRKAIEKAFELVRRLNDDRLVLVVTGYDGDEPGGYGEWLREEAERSGIRYMFIGDRVGALRGEKDGKRVFTLWDIYSHAHFVTYPSVYEGFGNALIETLYFRKPLFVHTYPPYLSDIKPAGVRAVEFTHDITADVLDQVRRIIDDPGLRDEMTEHNYQVGLKHFSFDVLRETMQRVMEGMYGK